MAFDPQAATEAHLAVLSAAELELARDYTTGNHWLILTGLIVSALVTWLIVKSGVLDWVFAKVSERWSNLRVFLVAAVFSIVNSLLTLPYSLYTDWWRATQYNRTSQPLGDYLSQSVISTLLATIFGAIFCIGLYFVLRRTGKLWWIWASGLVTAAICAMLLLVPTVIAPLFNEYTPVPEGEVREAILAMAAEADIPEDRIFVRGDQQDGPVVFAFLANFPFAAQPVAIIGDIIAL